MKLHIETHGAGKELVLLHGWGMHGGIWEGVQEQLAQHFRLHVVDLPGYGASSACEPYTLTRLAEILAGSFPGRVNVCGWSLGGQVALTWAQQSPAQVERLVLVGATPCFTKRVCWENGIDPEVFDIFARNLQQAYEATLKRFLSLQARAGEDARQVMAQLRANLFTRGRPSIEVLRAGLRILQESDLRDEIGLITQPVLLIHGEYDTLAPVAVAYWLKDHLLKARLEVVPGSAHAPFLSHRQDFIKLLVGFLRG
ncbi:pimeloyl-ACP methyl ester esterase BioH [Sulfurirhabdus autotrophica]|uniref:Pimeloyl-[acyl-carrier protein] methyl ester esterase n=1 Tax=Sulfurirhabdus autotrophica TaxID=1706046 RepID=A0A4R3XZG0_9PROT|nr:pimeloyl-ACP methyl ester esterase BioH [Sulfurirhabdus autotrophica]TCV84766.1 carboxylesterase BioH (pimeloyl-CoA synthesis) [Sulfurirhabdus autotrophica]